ncbi:MAG: hypothetical protein BWY73_01661 [candidate division TA06 bacterium ADurb.Bin417]|uniref:Uncharacterized protein n=1 Tax=candidate division TA06 bacterium ADurb.Bin417 TaxID=1852828 RepID=A0A1V5M5M3_UNCT6|nr:MAG: hypothetical protein BWY73_01661 [candidate division TA06 bacterium ADurb.Bin417]
MFEGVGGVGQGPPEQLTVAEPVPEKLLQPIQFIRPSPPAFLKIHGYNPVFKT